MVRCADLFLRLLQKTLKRNRSALNEVVRLAFQSATASLCSGIRLSRGFSASACQLTMRPQQVSFTSGSAATREDAR